MFRHLVHLIADFQVDKILSLHFRSNGVQAAEVEKLFRKMVKSALAELKEEGHRGTPHIQRSISMRYAGQNYEHDVKIAAEQSPARNWKGYLRSFTSSTSGFMAMPSAGK